MLLSVRMLHHVPSPHHDVEDDAPVPPFRLLTGRLPVTPPAADEPRLMGGTSALTSGRKPASAWPPEVGPALTVLADCTPPSCDCSVANGIACAGPVSPGTPTRPKTVWLGTVGNCCANADVMPASHRAAANRS